MIYKKDFEIRSRRTGSRLKGKENERIYYIVAISTQKKVDSPEFYLRKDADAWLTKNVKLANDIIKSKKEGKVNA